MHVFAPNRRILIEPAGLNVPTERLFRAVCRRPGAFLLDSGLSAGALGAWSFLGFDPFLRIGEGDDFRQCLAGFRSDAGDVPFAGGAVGYVSYEYGARRDTRLPPALAQRTAGPDYEFGLYDGIVAIDSTSGEQLLVANAVGPDSARAIIERLRRALDDGMASPPAEEEWRPASPTEVGASFTRTGYLRAVERIRDYIAAGDVYQVNLTQRFEARSTGSAYALYRRLRERTPAPFGAYLDFGRTQLLSSSPERFLRVRGRRAETRPIKGTRPRGRTAADDAALAAALRASAKDRAELLMIVDLERNDLGRVCEFGSVQVEENFRLESHPTVHHLVAQVAGRLRPGVDAWECFHALFPSGSITGAPKIRAMQLIAELEPCARHAYTGAIGYVGFDGSCDFNVAIRTMIVRGGQVRFHAGGGVVWDSDPAGEYDEMLTKAAAMMAAVTG